MNPIKKWNQLGLFTRIMVGFVLGIAAGLIFGEKATKLAFLGTILTRLLTMVVAPLVLGLLICSAADVKDFKTLGKIGGKTLGIFLGGTAIAVAIGLVLCNIMQIGAGFVMESAQAYDAKEIPSIVDTLMDIIPTNPFNSLSTQNLLQIIFFSLLLGFALIKLGEKGEPVLNFFRAWTEAWKEITNIVLEFTPYGVFGLIANIVGKYGAPVQTLLKKASTLDIKMICPLHGPILKDNLGYYIDKYQIWSSYQSEDEILSGISNYRLSAMARRLKDEKKKSQEVSN